MKCQVCVKTSTTKIDLRIYTKRVCWANISSTTGNSHCFCTLMGFFSFYLSSASFSHFIQSKSKAHIQPKKKCIDSRT